LTSKLGKSKPRFFFLFIFLFCFFFFSCKRVAVDFIIHMDERMRERNGAPRNQRSILFGDKKDSSSRQLAMQQNEELLQRDNDAKLEELQTAVGIIKNISYDIESGIKEGNQVLDDVDSNMSGVQALLKGTMSRLDKITQQAGSRHMCYLVGFVIFVFLILYFIVSRFSDVVKIRQCFTQQFK
jgi:hypothetical protein